MANRTVKDAHTVHGTNPQYLVEKIIRSRIYESRYWKEECFAVNEELLVERAAALKYIGGVHGGNIQPTPFLCLTLKMLQIQPAKEIVIEFIRQHDYKYARALGVFYLRLTHDSLECFRYLEPLFNDYRKLKRVDRQGVFSVVHMDEFVDELLREERACDVILPRLQKRHVLEEEGDLEARVSLLNEELQDVQLSDASEDSRGSLTPPASPRPAAPPQRQLQLRMSLSRSRSPPRPDRRKRSRSPSKSRSPARSPPAERHRKAADADTGGGNSESKKRRKDKEKRDKDRDRDRDRDRDPDKNRERDRGRNKDRDRDVDKADRTRDRDRDEDRDLNKDRDRGRDRGQRDQKRPPRPDEGTASRRDRDATSGGRSRGSKVDEEIREANKLRAELGIPLLKP